jgi:hypothetical protein
LAEFTALWRRCLSAVQVPKTETADFCAFRGLARPLQSIWHGRPGSPAAGSGRTNMLNTANIQQLALSVLGALVASSMFLSAALPVGQLI